MKHISELTQNKKAITPELCESAPKMPNKALARLWLLMGVKYGQRWTSQYPDEVTLKLAQAEWGSQLSSLTMDQIKTGLDNVVDEFPSWPPTIGEFKQICSCEKKNNWETQSHLMLADRRSYALTAEERRAVFAKHKDDLKNALNG